VAAAGVKPAPFFRQGRQDGRIRLGPEHDLRRPPPQRV
jgi:hypothetical protein